MMYQPNYYSQPQQDERVWVTNAQAAEAYPLAPGSFVRLWDSNTQVFYEKRSDINGRLFPMEVYEYKRKSMNSIKNEYEEQINELKARIEALERGTHEQSITDDSTV